MLLVGVVSGTLATIFSVIAMCMFFNPGAKIRFAVIISYLLLVLVILGVAVTLIRWFQLFINTGRLGKNKFSHKNKRKFRMAFIVLGILCVILAIVSAIGIFIFATKLRAVSTKLGKTTSEDKEDTSIVSVETKAEEEEEEEEVVIDRSWYNETCAKNETGAACQLCGQCPDVEACNVCQGSPRWCGVCECDPNMQGPLRCGWWRDRLAEQESEESETEQESSEGDSTESETEKKKPMQMLQEFVGEPTEDSQCYNVSYGLSGIRRTFCQLYEMTDSWHCKNGTDIAFFDMEETKRRISCIGGVVGEGATKRFIVSALLVVSIIGHLVSVSVAIWCTGEAEQSSEKGEGYKLQSDEQECGDEVKEEEDNEDDEGCEETDALTEIKL